MRSFSLLLSAALFAELAQPAVAHADEPLAPLPPAASVPAPPPLLPPEPQPALPPPPAFPTVRMHVNTRRPVTLEVISQEDTRWRPVCVAPCDVDVPLLGTYRVVDRGMLPSGPLELEAAPGDGVVVDVGVRTYDQYRTGERLTIASYIIGAVGLGLEIGALAVNSSSDAQPALVFSGLGAAVVAVGCTIGAYILREPTSLSQSSTTPGPKRLTAEPRAWTRAPVWSDAVGGAPSPKATNVPLFSTSF